MDSRTRVINVLKHKSIDRFPRTLWLLPNVKVFRKEQHDELFRNMDFDIANPDLGFSKSRYEKGIQYMMPEYTEA